LGTPLIMLGGYKPEGSGSGGSTATPGQVLKSQYDAIQAQIDQAQQISDAYESMNGRLGDTGFKGSANTTKELKDRIAALKGRQGQITEEMSGGRAQTRDDWGALEAIFGKMSPEERADYARKGAGYSFTEFGDKFGVKPDYTKILDDAGALVQNRPTATLMDLINEINGGAPITDPNHYADALMTGRGDVMGGVRTVDKNKLLALYARPSIADAQNNITGRQSGTGLENVLNKELGQLGIDSKFTEALAALNGYDFDGYTLARNNADKFMSDMSSSLAYTYRAGADPSIIDQKVADYQNNFDRAKAIRDDLNARRAKMMESADKVRAAFGNLPRGEQDQIERATHSNAELTDPNTGLPLSMLGDTVDPWEIIGREEPSGLRTINRTIDSFTNYVQKAHEDKANWQGANQSATQLGISERRLNVMSRMPRLETKHDQVFDKDMAKLVGDTKWSYGADATNLKGMIPALRDRFIAAQHKSGSPIGVMNDYTMHMRRNQDRGMYGLWSDLANANKINGKGGNADFIAAGKQYLDIQAQLAQMNSKTDPTDAISQKRIMDLEASRNNLVANSGYLPPAFTQLEATQAAILSNQAAMPNSIVKTISDAYEKYSNSVADYKNRDQDQAEVFRPKRHTGGQVNASNEYTLQNTEGLVLTGSKMDKVIGALGSVASASNHGQYDAMSSLASTFLGHSAEDGVLFHEHSGNVGVTMSGQDDFYAKIAEAVAAKIGKGSSAPMKGQRIKRPYEN
jgi:hypothetical protein